MTNKSTLLTYFNIGCLAGVVGGITIGLFFNIVERIWNIKVYTLLLNIDYIPGIQKLTIPENIEFLLHLLVSVLLGICLILIIHWKKWQANRVVAYTVAASLLVGLLLFPTTALSERTPEVSNIVALFVWMIGHLIYGWILGVLYKKHYIYETEKES